MTDSLTISLVQAETIWQDPESNLAQLEELLSGVDADIIVLPEMFATGFTFESDLSEVPNGRVHSWLKFQADSHQAVMIGSVLVNEKGKLYNRAVIAFPDGKVKRYDKKHLFTFAGEQEHLQAGDERLVFEWQGFNICPMICYDLRFPEWSRNHYREGNLTYDLLIYMANWPEPRHSAWQKLLPARAIENSAFVAGVNRCGKDGNNIQYAGGSAVFGPTGEDLGATSEESAEEVISVRLSLEDLRSYREKFPVHIDSYLL